MKRKQKPDEQTRRALGLSVVMAAAMLFLTAVLVRSAFRQFIVGHAVSGVISALGAVIFFGVGVMMAADLCRHRARSKNDQEDGSHGS